MPYIKKKESRITNKLIRRLLIIDTSVFLIIICLLWAVLFPFLITSTLEKDTYINEILVNPFDSHIKNVMNYGFVIMSNASLKKDLSLYLNEPENPEYFEKLRIDLNRFASSETGFRRIVLELSDGTRFDSITLSQENDLKIFENANYSQLTKNEKSVWLSPIYQNSRDSEYSSIAYSCNHTLLNNQITLTIFSDLTSILSYASSLLTDSLDDFILYDSLGNILYCTNPDNLAEYTYSLSDLNSLKSQKMENGRYIFTASGKNSICILLSFANITTVYKDFLVYFFITLVLFALIYILTILLFTPSLRHMLAPVKDLLTSMSKASSGNLEVRCDIETDDEIGDLSRIFNDMIANLNIHTHQLIHIEHEKRVMLFSLITSQINPHFIFNTMNMITVLAQNEQYKEIISLNSSLIQLLQDRLRISDTDVTDTVTREINIIQQYLNITKYRTTANVTVSYQISPEDGTLQIPKNILQPVVENCLFHGLYDDETGKISGNILISVNLTDTDIILKITDNGKGISKSKLALLNAPIINGAFKTKGQHIGLQNIKQRLSLLYPEQNCFQIESTCGCGTTITITIPLHTSTASLSV